jgi:hypothetical protein
MRALMPLPVRAGAGDHVDTAVIRVDCLLGVFRMNQTAERLY